MATSGVARSIHADVDACEQFLVREHPGMLRAAFLLTGDQVSAQDLAQETAVRVVVQWRKVARADSPQAYARKVMLHAFLGGRRRAWAREVPHDAPPDEAVVGTSAYEAVDEQDRLSRALMALPPRQRAAVVLRYWEDRSEAETAQLMGCSVGNVKALASRGLAQLRDALSATAGSRSNEGTAQR